ncbi:hypothetical protein ACWD48_29390 [Streptomyces sp. NPDC002519]
MRAALPSSSARGSPEQRAGGRLALTASGTAAVEYALGTSGATAPSASVLSAGRTEPSAWAA